MSSELIADIVSHLHEVSDSSVFNQINSAYSVKQSRVMGDDRREYTRQLQNYVIISKGLQD